jgi:hypothetical protein
MQVSFLATGHLLWASERPTYIVLAESVGSHRHSHVEHTGDDLDCQFGMGDSSVGDLSVALCYPLRDYWLNSSHDGHHSWYGQSENFSHCRILRCKQDRRAVELVTAMARRY